MLFDQVLVRAAQRFSSCFTAIRAGTFTNTEAVVSFSAPSYSSQSQVAAAAPSSFSAKNTDQSNSRSLGLFREFTPDPVV